MELRLSDLRRRAGFVLAALACALTLSSTASADAPDYASPLYLSGQPSAQVTVTRSHTLVTSPGPGMPATAPGAAVGAAGNVTSGTYTYVFTVVDPVGGETAPSPVSNSVSVSAFGGSKQINVSGLPTGVTVRLYRKRSTWFYRVAELAPNASPTYVDNLPESTMLPILPVSQNRARSFLSGCTTVPCVGYADFAPAGWAHWSNDSTLVSGPLPTSPSGLGWIVDGPGNVHFAAGPWTLEAEVESGGSANGEAHLVAGVWKVTASGGAISGSTLVLDPNTAAAEGTQNLIMAANGSQVVTQSFVLPAFTLAPDEHLYVQLWRRQTVQMSGGAPNRLLTLRVYDGRARLSHAGVSTLPNAPALADPDAGAVANDIASLSASFSDPDAGDAGSVEFRVCRDPGCADVVAVGSSGSVANGATASWPIGVELAAGMYHWQARSHDALGGSSAWSATRSFRINAAPGVPLLMAPVDATFANTVTSLSSSFSDPDAGDTGSVEFRVCRDVACADVAATGNSDVVANGATGTWTISPSLPPGSYRWQARAQDGLGRISAWSAARSFRVNGAPAVPFLVTPDDGAVLNQLPFLAAGFEDPDGPLAGSVEFRVCGDEACGDVRASATIRELAHGDTAQAFVEPALGPGAYFWQARAVDALGLASAWSDARRLRLNAAPDSAQPAPARPGTVRDPSPGLAATYVDPEGDPGLVRFRICRAPAPRGRECAGAVASGVSPQVASGARTRWSAPRLPDGVYYWQARNEDATGAASPWSATTRLVVASRLIRVTSADRFRCDVGAYVVARFRLADDARVVASYYASGRYDGSRDLGVFREGVRAARVRLRWALERPAVYRIKLTARRPGEASFDVVTVVVSPIREGELPSPCRQA